MPSNSSLAACINAGCSCAEGTALEGLWAAANSVRPVVAMFISELDGKGPDYNMEHESEFFFSTSATSSWARVQSDGLGGKQEHRLSLQSPLARKSRTPANYERGTVL